MNLKVMRSGTLLFVRETCTLIWAYVQVSGSFVRIDAEHLTLYDELSCS